MVYDEPLMPNGPKTQIFIEHPKRIISEFTVPIRGCHSRRTSGV